MAEVKDAEMDNWNNQRGSNIAQGNEKNCLSITFLQEQEPNTGCPSTNRWVWLEFKGGSWGEGEEVEQAF